MARANLGRYEEAIEDYTRVIETNPGDAKVLYERGTAHLFVDRKGDAIEGLQRRAEDRT